MSKLSNKEASKIFSQYGYDLIGPYTNTHSNCMCRCQQCNGTVEIPIHHIDKRGRCKNCAHIEITKCFHNNKCKLLSEPSRSRQMKYMCSCGNVSTTKWFNFKNGERCKRCATEKMKLKNTKRLNVERSIFKYFETMGCKLLESSYTNQSTPMRYICSCGREDVIMWKSFQKGCRCHQCAKEKIRNRFIPSGERHSHWNPDRKAVETNKKVREKAKSALRRALRITNKAKLEKTFDSLGYSKNDLIEHITNHPNWHSIKNENWELDHYFPVKAFVDHGIYDEKIINALDNLRPISRLENRKKNDTYDAKEFKGWLCYKGISIDS